MDRKNFIIGLVASLTLIVALTVGSYLLFRDTPRPIPPPPPSGARLVLPDNPAEVKK